MDIHETRVKALEAVDWAEHYFGDGTHWNRNLLPHLRDYLAQIEAQAGYVFVPPPEPEPEVVPVVEAIPQDELVTTDNVVTDEPPTDAPKKGKK